MKYKKEEYGKYMNGLKKLCFKLGRKPTHKEINSCPYTASKTYYVYNYGCMDNVFKKINCDNFNSKEGIKKEKIIKSFYELKKELGYTPSSVDWKKYTTIDISVIYRLFNTWNNFLKELGEEVCKKIPICFKNKKRIFIAEDGHVCYSKMECKIDNILYNLGLEHDNEVFYPYDKQYNKNKRKRCDFKVEDIYIEYVGMLSYFDKNVKKKYISRLDDKLNLCLNQGLNFIYIEPEKLINIKTDLKEVFKK